MSCLTLTGRFVILEAFGILLIFASFFTGLGLAVFIFYNCLCISLLIADYYITPGREAFDAERIGENRLSIYENEKILIRLHNRCSFKLNIEMKDDVPDRYFNIVQEVVKKSIAPHESGIFEYTVVPQKRGAYSFENINIRLLGRLGLIKKVFIVQKAREYRVYPNLKNLRKYHMAVCSNRQYKNGLKNLRMIGAGTSFESLREYNYGDEYRKINWKATAREGKPIINQYEPERDQHVYALIDTGRSMSYKAGGICKLDMAVNTSLVLSDIANQNGDKSGLMAFNTEVQNFIAPGKGASHRNKMMDALYHIESTNYTSNYEEAFFYLKRNEKHRSIIFLFTDFDSTEEAEEIIGILHMIAKSNIVIVMLIKNEALEKIAASKASTEIEAFDRAVAMELLTDRKKIISRLNKAGIMCIESEPENIEINTINRYIKIKNSTKL